MKDVLNLLLDLESEGVSIFLEDGKLRYRTSDGLPKANIITRIKYYKEEIIQFLEDGDMLNRMPLTSTTIGVQERPSRIPLSFAQERLWIIDKMQGSENYHLPMVLRINGKIDKQLLEKTFKCIIQRHEVLRTVFKEDNDIPYQYVLIDNKWTLQYTKADSHINIKNVIQNDIIRPFDLANDYMLRAHLVKLAEAEYILTIVMHHIVSDGWSTPIFLKELVQSYDSLLANRDHDLSNLPIQYIDYSIWQRSYLSGDFLNKELAYWQQKLEDIEVLYFPCDFPRPAVQSTNGDIIHFTVDKDLTGKIKSLSKSEGVTLFTSLLTAFKILIYRYTDQTDICIGCPVSNRNNKEIYPLIGFFVNVLVLRSDLSNNPTYRELLHKVKDTTLEAISHQEVPFEKVVEHVEKSRDISRSPIFQVMFVFQNNDPIEEMNVEGVNISVESDENKTSRVDLSFTVIETENSLNINIIYCTDLFRKETIVLIMDHFKMLLSAITANRNTAIDNLNIISSEERKRIVEIFNNTVSTYPKKSTLIELFESRVLINPDAIALVFEDSHISYKELNERSNQLAHYLRDNYSIEQDDLLGIKLGRSEKMVIAMLGILKSGAGYVPIDPEYPNERIEYLIENSRCKVVLDEDELFSFNVMRSRYSKVNPKKVNNPNSIAYVMYTSGSTGQPKGVVIEHASVINEITCQAARFGILEEDRILQTSNYVFDTSVEQIFMSLLNGANLFLINKDTLIDTQKLEQIIEEFGITHLHLTPRLLNYVTPRKYRHLKRVLSGGETVPLDLAKAWVPFARFFNKFGPTETTINATTYEYIEGPDSHLLTSLPIGKPLCNTFIYILDRCKNIVPIGISGEMYIAGDNLGREYIGASDWTKEKFIQLDHITEKRLYRTGDIARWLHDGNIEFIGRKDGQVKISGYRIELGEIEAIIHQFSFVRHCVVLMKTDGDQEKYLVAYIVAGDDYSDSEFQDHLKKRLPDYMIPKVVFKLESLPLTATGKVDVKHLMKIQVLGYSDSNILLPLSDTETTLLQIWKDILGKENIFLDDNFFEIGGHSLKATRLSSQIFQTFHVRLELKDLFIHPILKDQALLIQQSEKKAYHSIIPQSSLFESYVMSSAQRRLWVLSQFEGGNIAYNMPGVYIFEGNLDKVLLEKSFCSLISRHEILRTVFKENEVGEVRQFIKPVEETGFVMGYMDLHENIGLQSNLPELIQADFIKAFDLSEGPLLRAHLYHLSEGQWVFSYVMHHIISDGWSMGILIRELLLFYNGYVNDDAYNPSALRIQYKDYSAWQQQQLVGGHLEEDKAYWLSRFAGEKIPVLQLPSDRMRPSVKTYRGSTVSRILDKELSVALQRVVQQEGATLFMGLLAAVNILLYRYSGQEDIIIGSPIAGRPHTDLEDQIGFYVNTLALRTQLKGSDSYIDVLRELKEQTLDAYKHQMYPFDELVDALRLPGDLSRSPLFDVMVVLQNAQLYENTDSLAIHNIHAENYNITEHKVSLFDLRFDFKEIENSIQASIEFNTDLFEEGTINRLLDHFDELLRRALEHLEISISQLGLLKQEEKKRLLFDFNDTIKRYPEENSIISLFEEEVYKNPNAVAVVFGQNELTYSRLNTLVNQLSDFLVSYLDVRQGDRIALLLERTEYLIISMMAVLKSGAVYVPVEPSYPLTRIYYILRETATSIVLTDSINMGICDILQWEIETFNCYICVDPMKTKNFTEFQEESKRLWNYTAEKSDDQISASGWKSSYTGEVFSKKEIEESVLNVANKLKPYINTSAQVLEVGVGSGLILFEIAPKVKKYTGTDISDSVLKVAQDSIDASGIQNTKLLCLTALELDQLSDQKFDLIIVNSVIQYFPNLDYLRYFISGCLELLSDDGVLFLGDLRDKSLQADYYRSLISDYENLEEKIIEKRLFEEELFVDRRFFNDFMEQVSYDSSVTFSNKEGTILNELLLYRTDTLIKINKKSVRKFKNKLHKKQVFEVRYNNYNSGNSINIRAYPGSLSYILYTSGSTGQPKGVMIRSTSVCAFINWCKDEFKDSKIDIVYFATSICFDLSVFEIFYSLCSGKKIRVLASGLTIPDYVQKDENILLNTVPSVIAVLLDNRLNFTKISVINMAGEKIPERYLDIIDTERIEVRNLYGPTEDTTYSTVQRIHRGHKITIGGPITNTRIYILSSTNQLQPIGVVGEIFISGAGVAEGYVNSEILTMKKFTQDIFYSGAIMYSTGDLGRWLNNGTIELLGRNDEQVKIRGFRIELEEIEKILQQHVFVNEAVVLGQEDASEEKNLVAYIVACEAIGFDEIKSFLRSFLPEYMIPTKFIFVDKFPLTASGKVNRNQLGRLYYMADVSSESDSEPTNETEKSLLLIWKDILSRNDIRISDSFFHLGGHSLKATRLAGRIFKEFNVKVSLSDLFTYTTISDQANLVKKSKNTGYYNITPTARKEYYLLSSAQKRLFYIYRFAPESTAYNMPIVIYLQKIINKDKIVSAIQRLITRHESLRTSFVMVEDMVYQKVHEHVDFVMNEFECYAVGFQSYLDSYIKPFDLTQSPLLRCCLVKIIDQGYALIFDMHHIISDGTSHEILTNDFLNFYNEHELPKLKLQYKDFSEWQNNQSALGDHNYQKDYWLSVFKDGIPKLSLPLDFSRPDVFNFKGAKASFVIDANLTAKIREINIQYNGTLQMYLMSVLFTLLYKYTDDDDIVMGSGVAGRRHPDVENIVGMFVNALSIRCFPSGDKSFSGFFLEVIKASIDSYDHQDLQFEDLVDLLKVENDSSRNPIFDIYIIVQNFTTIEQREDLLTKDFDVNNLIDNPVSDNIISSTAKFDMAWFVQERVDDILVTVEYYSSIFSETTIRRVIKHFKKICNSTILDLSILLRDIVLVDVAEQKKIIEISNSQLVAYPNDLTIHEIFEKQALLVPDNIAIKCGTEELTYVELNHRSNQLANYLLTEAKLIKEEAVAILLDRNVYSIISILGVLKAGGMYVPMDIESPEARLKFTVNDCASRILISEKSFIETSYRLQWACSDLEHFICINSDSVFDEVEREQNLMMSQDLWDHVAESSTDAITGGGWINSFTGLPLSQLEMDEYSENAFLKLKDGLDSKVRVLEIGCSSGLTMKKIAPKVSNYFGTDLSPKILSKTKLFIEREKLDNVILQCVVADKINDIPEKDFDLIILNSVIQHFHGHNYLKRVIIQSIGLLKNTGRIFIGDVMDINKKEQLIHDLKEFRTKNKNSEYKTKIDFSSDLFVSRDFFSDLACEISEIVAVEISEKIFSIENELTKYRYDVILNIDKNNLSGIAIQRTKQQVGHNSIVKHKGTNPKLNITPDNLAYAIYTSGTTGKPKGALIQHSNVVRLFFNDRPIFNFSRNDVWTMFHSYTFDFSVWEMYGALFYGAKLIIIPLEVARDPDLFINILQQESVSVLNQTPSSFYNLNKFYFQRDINETCLRYVIFGGEALAPNKLLDWFLRYPSIILVNMYGITETTVHVTYKVLAIEDINCGMSNIGIAIPTASCYVLDQYQRILPFGVYGELYVGGAGVGRGYINRNELTRQKFIKNPFGKDEYLYRSGDKVRMLDNGDMEYAGRLDQQVKVRGYRIELGEIEKMLESHPDVDNAIVIAKANLEGDNDLNAYLISKKELNSDEIRLFLSSILPSYMIPMRFIGLDELPLTNNGKVDRKRLLTQLGLALVNSSQYTPPSNELERKLVDIWSRVLNIQHIGITNTFLSLGGHSLLAVRITSVLNSDLNIKISIANFFKYDTIQLLSNYIQFITSVKQEENEEYVTLTL